MDPVPFFVMGLMVGSVGILLGQAFGRRRALARPRPKGQLQGQLQGKTAAQR